MLKISYQACMGWVKCGIRTLGILDRMNNQLLPLQIHASPGGWSPSSMTAT